MRKNILISAFLAASVPLFAATAPDFTVSDSDGNPHQLYADYVNQGKVLVLEVFFTTCPPCATHAPYWQNLYDAVKMQHPGQVEFMMLSNKSFDMNTNVAQYKTSKGLTMPGVGAQGGSLAAVQPYEGGQFGVFYGTPTFIVVAPGTGEVSFDLRGDTPAETMGLIQQRINQLLLPTCIIPTYLGDTLQNYNLQIAVPGGASTNLQVTNGKYSLENASGLPVAPFYLATPNKNNDPLNGVSTFDLLQINKQILGIELFDKPWQFIAADANNSGTISTFDIVELRKLILGIYDTLPNAPSWVFTPAQDTMNSNTCPAITALKKGDVNGNADPKSLLGVDDRSGNQWLVESVAPETLQGQNCVITLRLTAPLAVQGFQLALNFDPEAILIQSIRSDDLPDFQADNWFCADGRLALSWFANQAVRAKSGALLLHIAVQTLRAGSPAAWLRLEASPLRAEAYDSDGGIHQLGWQTKPTPAASVLSPNPARQYFDLLTESAADRQTVIRMVDQSGRTVYEARLPLKAGANRLRIQPDRLPTGLYMVTVDGRRAGKLVWQE